jgi:hypothetical protein
VLLVELVLAALAPLLIPGLEPNLLHVSESGNDGVCMFAHCSLCCVGCHGEGLQLVVELLCFAVTLLICVWVDRCAHLQQLHNGLVSLEQLLSEVRYASDYLVGGCGLLRVIILIGVAQKQLLICGMHLLLQRRHLSVFLC